MFAVIVAVVATVGLVISQTEIRPYFTHWVGAPVSGSPISGVPEPAPDLRFGVVGDIGTGDSRAYSVADAMVRHSSSRPIDGIIFLGDNVYPNGDPSRLEATLFAPYGPLINGGAEVLPVLGNHDVRDGNAGGQMATLGMPGRWYSQQIGELLFIGLDSTITGSSDQMKWLETTLAEARARWIVVAAHHPPYSAGMHGSHEASRQAFVPLYEKYGVDLVLAGHDHDYQASETINGVTYVVSGGGAKTRPTSRSWFTQSSWSVLHFLDVAVYDDRMEVLAVSTSGQVFDSFDLPVKADRCGGIPCRGISSSESIMFR